MIDKEILRDFQQESKGLILTMVEILEDCEDNFLRVKRLEEYGQVVDRIMGGAKSLALLEKDKDNLIYKIGDYAAVCKAVGYKASQIQGNEDFYKICVALLLDATEVLEQMINSLDKKVFEDIRGFISQTLLDRVKWVSAKFGGEYRASVAVNKAAAPQKLNQSEIDNLLAKLGLG